jgi:hypothetical protein
MKRPNKTILLASFILSAFTAAHASVYSQALNLNNDGGPFSSPVEQIADAFQLSAATSLLTLDWYGDNYANSFPSTLSFVVNLYADAGGIPANSPFSSQTVMATAVNTGLTELDCCTPLVEIFRFDATLPSAVALSGFTTYWLSILDPNGSGNTLFRWANGTTTWVADPANVCCVPGSWSPILAPREQAAYDLNPVPEPGSFALLGSGVVGLAAVLRRKLTR